MNESTAAAPATDVSIRSGGTADAAAVAALHAMSWRSAYAGIVPAEILGDGLAEERSELWSIRLGADYGEPTNTPQLLVAENAEGELIGFGYLVPQPDGRVLLDNLHVRPGHTGAGTGAALLRASRARVAEVYGGAELYLEVLAANHRAIAFYERAGGVRTRRGYAGFRGGVELPEFEYSWPRG
ncbi:GNAT family N-acetyltransferase [Kitasatospora nipponensis]|uniref:GNAT family N-acetyltransferase n=1 Tax=Kitasatospora nipponensis TaxID=258049 RepID=A0ABN1VUD2_9ACTN